MSTSTPPRKVRVAGTPASSHRSIAVKLPLAFATVLLVLGTAMAVVSYLEVRQTVTSIAAERLQQATAQMATVLGASGRGRVAAMQQLMRQPDVIAYLRTRQASQAPPIEKAIRQYLGTATAIANVELWDASGSRLLATGAPFQEAAGAARGDYIKELQSRDAIIGRLRLESDALVYPVGGRIDDNGVALGFVVERRRIANPSQSLQTVALLSGLIGSAATIVVGNDDGSAWTNLSAAVAGVPITRDATDRLLDYERPGMPRMLAWAKRIEATPWLVAIEFPRDAVMAPADRLVRRASLIAFVLLVIAAATGWAFSHRITRPLGRVTEAAEAAAELRHVAPIDIDRRDEIGRLADAFNVMTERVQEARHDLERRVEDRTAELTAVNRELESFSYSVSHDLRAPLRAIAGFVQILEEDHAGTLNADGRHALQRVKANATRMGQLIDDLLTFARIGRTPVTRHRVDLTHLARSLADEAIAAAEHPIELVIEPLPPCAGEPALLRQVLANLISNAVKFTARSQHARVTIGATTNGETTYFVRDNGAGFDERFAEKLFGVFQRLHRTSEFEGTGVGLAIVQRIIMRHGGRVWAEGKVNGGATFYFTLPPAPVSSESGRHRVAAVLLLLSLFSGIPSARAQHWPEFRGPGGQGHSVERGLPLQWGEGKNVAWKTPVPGLGWSSPVVADGRVWLTTAIDSRSVSLRVLAFDAATGREVVNVEAFNIPSYRREINPKNSWASPTPVIDNGRVYVHFGADGTAALSTSGEIIWKARFDYASQHGAGGSPIVYGDLLIFSCDGSDAAFVIALDKNTGKVKWKTNRGFPADQAYTTPLIIRAADRDQLVSVGAFRARAYDPITGKEIWRVRYDEGFSNVPRPVFAHGLVYITTGFQQPSLLAVRADGTGDVTKTHVAWTLTRGAPLTPSPLAVGDELYVVTDGGIATCLDARSGTILWQQRLGGTYSASPVFADGRIYFLAEQGVTTVIAPRKPFQRLAMNSLDGGLLASMAVAGGSFFLRTDTHLYRITEPPQ